MQCCARHHEGRYAARSRRAERLASWPVQLLLVSVLLIAPGIAAHSSGQQPEPSNQSGPATQAGPTGDYVLQRGDELEIKVFNLPELTESLRIRPDGKISLQVLNDVTAAGLTTAELRTLLTNEYAKEYRNPRVAVIVKSFSNQNIYVGGEVGQPGVMPLRGDLTALAAILQAGGIKETARTNNIILLRNSGAAGKPQVIKIGLNDILKNSKPDVRLQPFDVVYVPKSTIAKADQFMRQYVRDLLPISVNAGFSYLLGVTALK